MMLSREALGCDWIEFGITPEIFARKVVALPARWKGPGWYSDEHDTVLCVKAPGREHGWYDWICWNHPDVDAIKARLRETAAAIQALVDEIESKTGRTCPDDGKCHHACTRSECFRVRTCEPLSGVYEGDVWPDHLIEEFGS